MTIDLAADIEQLLTTRAKEAGYDSPESFVADYVVALALEPASERLAPMTEDELKASLEMIDRSMADIAAGRVLSVDEARERAYARLRAQEE